MYQMCHSLNSFTCLTHNTWLVPVTCHSLCRGYHLWRESRGYCTPNCHSALKQRAFPKLHIIWAILSRLLLALKLKHITQHMGISWPVYWIKSWSTFRLKQLLSLYHLESRWRNSHVLVHHGPLLSHLMGVVPSGHLLSPQCGTPAKSLQGHFGTLVLTYTVYRHITDQD